jgi:hypothetical protein
MRHLFAVATLAFGPHVAVGRSRLVASTARRVGSSVLELLDRWAARADSP